ncbi:hypothetical protein CKO13_02405 [Halorhodospira neutriphila]|uniref:Uncharacterized protein n=1 Tax=Halorhodospira neutriphila TaxID=168379 RepID=A0ABS1E320_9GAMM|nr:hypothetical protein [Halorhodospira neutriphila]
MSILLQGAAHGLLQRAPNQLQLFLEALLVDLLEYAETQGAGRGYQHEQREGDIEQEGEA